MTATCDVIEVVCVRCGENYCEWYRPFLENRFSSTCPHCGHDQASDPIVRENGTWITAGDDEARSR